MSVDSLKRNKTLVADPRSTSIPANVPVTPAPDSPSLSTISLSLTVRSVVDIVVCVPVTVKFPVIVVLARTENVPVGSTV